jgi:lysyl-tRNA synthetase class 1
VEDWLRYATPESLSLYMFQKPKTAKRLYFDVIPKAVDEYVAFLGAFDAETPDRQVENPVWHIHSGAPPREALPVSFALLLNLVSAADAGSKDVLWGFIRRYAPAASPEANPMLDALAARAIAFYEDFVKPAKRFRPPTAVERTALADLSGRLAAAPGGVGAEALQDIVYAVGKDHPFENLRDWFKAIYETLLGQEQGPRFGSFIALYGVAETRALIERALTTEPAAA